jgi:hypothetical protein
LTPLPVAAGHCISIYAGVVFLTVQKMITPIRPFLLSLVAIYTFVFAPLTPLWAEENPPREDTPIGDFDVAAPMIVHQPPREGAQGPLEIEATITDDVAVTDPILFYRVKGGHEYAQIRMNAKGENRYVAVIPEKDVLAPGIEYYIQVSDKAGNYGFSTLPSTPVFVSVAPPPPQKEKAKIVPEPPPVVDAVAPMKEQIAEPPLYVGIVTIPPVEQFPMTQPPSRSAPWYKKWWVWTIVLLAGGGIAASQGGDSGSSSGSGTGMVEATFPQP